MKFGSDLLCTKYTCSSCDWFILYGEHKYLLSILLVICCLPVIVLVLTQLFYTETPRVGSGFVGMDPLRFLAGCCTRRLNQA